ncbi:MAG: hypothetical protein QOG20_5500 [Pseudonocardiales bacterium]|jgi:hypothetical protein|nr:hypothetical protein [Pseudonocardiales bacterium]
MGTSKKDASLAGKQLADKKSTKAEKSVAASDLSQANRSRSASTGKKDASLASKQLTDKNSTKAEKSVAASDLSQSKKPAAKKKR